MRKQIIFLFTVLLGVSFCKTQAIMGNLAEDTLKSCFGKRQWAQQLKRLPVGSMRTKQCGKWEEYDVHFKKLGDRVIAMQLPCPTQKGHNYCGYHALINSQILGMFDQVVKVCEELGDKKIYNKINNLLYILSKKHGWGFKTWTGRFMWQEGREDLSLDEIMKLNYLFGKWFIDVQGYPITFLHLISESEEDLFDYPGSPQRRKLKKKIQKQKPTEKWNKKKRRNLVSRLSERKMQRTVIKSGEYSTESDFDSGVFEEDISFEFMIKDAAKIRAFNYFRRNKNAKEVFVAAIPSMRGMGHWIAVRAEKIKVNGEDWLALVLADSFFGNITENHDLFFKELAKKLGYKVQDQDEEEEIESYDFEDSSEEEEEEEESPKFKAKLDSDGFPIP